MHMNKYTNIHRIKIVSKKLGMKSEYWHKLERASSVTAKQFKLFSQYGNFNSIYTGTSQLFFINLLALKS